MNGFVTLTPGNRLCASRSSFHERTPAEVYPVRKRIRRLSLLQLQSLFRSPVAVASVSASVAATSGCCSIDSATETAECSISCYSRCSLELEF